MPAKENAREYAPIVFGGVLDESQTPSKVGGSGLTACQNLVYRRFGAWGKRAGSTLVYVAVIPATPPPQPPAPPNPYTPPPPNPPAPQPPPGTPKTPGPKTPIHGRPLE